MDFYEVFVRSPVNRSAGAMLSGKDNVEKEIQFDELRYLISRLQRKRKMLDYRLGVKKKNTRKNLMYKISHDISFLRTASNKEILQEWARNGQAIERLSRELEIRRKSCAHENLKMDMFASGLGGCWRCVDCKQQCSGFVPVHKSQNINSVKGDIL